MAIDYSKRVPAVPVAPVAAPAAPPPSGAVAPSAPSTPTVPPAPATPAGPYALGTPVDPGARGFVDPAAAVQAVPAAPVAAGFGRRLTGHAVDELILLVPTVALLVIAVYKAIDLARDTAARAQSVLETSTGTVGSVRGGERPDVSVGDVTDVVRDALSLSSSADSAFRILWVLLLAIVGVRVLYRFVGAVRGATPGRALAGATVRDLRGGPAGWPRALARAALPSAVFLAGCAFPPFWLLLLASPIYLVAHPGGRSLLDLATGTQVVRRTPVAL